MVDNYAAFYDCTPMGRASDSMMAPTIAIHFKWLGPELFVCCLAHRGSTGVFFFFFFFFFVLLRVSVSYSASRESPSSESLLNMMSPRFLLIRVVIMIYSFVLDDSLTS